MLRIKRPITTVFFASLTFVFTSLVGIITHDDLQASVFNKTEVPVLGNLIDPVTRIDPEAYSPDGEFASNTVIGKYGVWTFCQYDVPESANYDVELQSVEVQEDIQSSTVFQVTVTLKNTGNVRLFSQDSDCVNQTVFNLGTQKEQDRESVFGGMFAISGWEGSTRVKMTDDYVDPDGTFTLQFQSLAPEGDDIYREFFQPVLEGVAWLGEPFGVDIVVGSPTETMQVNISFVTDVSIAASSLEGLERNLEIDLSTQMMYARFGEQRVWSMLISSGHYDTPTPRGNYQILSKQELRIGGKAPHYRMPYFQLWRWDGYGLHALPYLANDGGSFWAEALDHIGRPVSHGCVRTLPNDAVTAYNFTDIGTAIWIH